MQYTKTKAYGSQKYIGLKLVLKEHSYIFASFGVVDKAVTRRTENLPELDQKRFLFLQLEAEKKTPFFVQLKQIFGRSYFDRALAVFV